jgi:hypothetical protein
MNAPSYIVPDSAPVWVKNILKGSPARRSIQILIGLSIFAAAAGAYGAQWNRSALAALFFLYYAFVAWAALRWADQHGVFSKEEPNQPPQTTPSKAPRV